MNQSKSYPVTSFLDLNFNFPSCLELTILGPGDHLHTCFPYKKSVSSKV